MAPRGQNHHTSPQVEHEFLGMDFGEDDAQADEELYQQYQNESRLYPATARYSNSVPDPSLPQINTSAGCEPEPVISVTDPFVLPQPSISAGNEENSPPSVSAPDQTPCESIEATAGQCCRPVE